jgi:hypothetical protein
VTVIKKFIHSQGKLLVRPVIRTKEEFFSTTVLTYLSTKKPSVVINGNFYDLTTSGYLDVMSGNDPVAADNTIPLGLVIQNGSKVAGNSAAQDFVIAFNDYADISKSFLNAVKTGQGDPPLLAKWSGFGGLGPIIINGLPYGRQNKYSQGAPADAPPVGAPTADAKKYLTQRSSAKFSAFAARDSDSGNTLGKTCVGVSDTELLIFVQEDGVAGQSIESIRDEFLTHSCKHAVFFDGSDSSLMAEKDAILAKQGPNKDESCTIGVAFFWLKS